MAPLNTKKAREVAYALRPRVLALSVAACFTIAPAFALPTGGQVVAGSVKFNNQTPNSLVITNTPGAIINWNNFSVGAIETVKFQQQSSLSSVLNRVTGNTSSSIQGSLLSNGRVFLLNPNGILFGPNSKVDVGGLVASTLNIGDSDFRKGKLNFQGGENPGAIQNAGILDAAKNIYLIAPDIENSGILRSAKGEVLLAAGRQVSLIDAAHPDIQVVVSAPADKAVNLGEIVAGKISIFGALVQQKGKANADRVEVDEKGRIVFKATKQLDLEAGSQTTANGPSGGSITLQTTEGDTYVKGNVSATGKVGAGGTAQILGQRVAVMDNAVIDASGEAGGGTILVGGDYQGKNAAVQNSTATWFGPDAILKANANTQGDGGKIIVWADDVTRAYGTVEAKGGSQSGNGGFVETSGKFLDVAGINVNTGGGMWLLDPYDINISTGTTANVDPSPNFDAYGATAVVNNSDIVTALGGNNVRVTTTDGNITVSAPVSWSTSYGLDIYAQGSIAVNADIESSANNNITLISGWDGNTGSPAVSGSGGISINSAKVTTGGLGVVLVKSGSDGISTTGTGTGTSGAFLQGKIALQSAGPISVSKLDGDFVATSTGSGSAISIGDPGGMTVSSSAIGGVAAGITTTNGNVNLEAYGGQLYISGPVTVGTGQVKAVASGGGYDLVASGTLSGDNIVLSATDQLSVNQINSSSSTSAKVSLTGQSSLLLNNVVYGGDIRLITDSSITFDGGSVYSLAAGSGSVELTTATAGRAIDVSSAPAGAGLNINTGDLGSISAPNIIFGNDHATYGSGTLTVSGVSGGSFASTPTAIAFLSKSAGGYNITLSSISLTSGTVGIMSGGNIDASASAVDAPTILAKSTKTGGGAIDIWSTYSGTTTVGSITALVDGTSTTYSGIQSNGGHNNITAAGSLAVSSPINAGSGNVKIDANAGSITGTGGITGNWVSLKTVASPGTVGVLPTPLVTAASYLTVDAYGGVFITNTGALKLGYCASGTCSPVKSANGGITIENTGAVTTYGNTSYGGTTNYSGSYAADAYGGVSITANSPLTVEYGGNIRAQNGGIHLTAGSGGALAIDGTVSAPNASVTLAAGSRSGSGTVVTLVGGSVSAASYAFTDNTPSNNSNNNNNNSGPSLNDCTSNPSQPGCSSVLPSLDACTTNPTGPGCSAVLPTVDACVTNPTAAGCTAVLPPLDTCVTNPTAAGCSAVLPPLSTCTTNPTAAGCSAVLPPLDTCVTNPTAAGCSAVLPPLSTCTTNPTAAGCSAVLPPLDTCVTNPTAAGCSAVLPPLSTCTTNPTAPGCSVVLPPVDTCVTNPSAPGCSVVLPPVTLPTEQQLACYIDPASCTPGGGTTGTTTNPTVVVVVQKIGEAKQTFTLSSQTGLTGSGTVNFDLLPTGNAPGTNLPTAGGGGTPPPQGGGGTSGGTGTTQVTSQGPSGSPDGSGNKPDEENKPQQTADTSTPPAQGTTNATPAIKYCN